MYQWRVTKYNPQLRNIEGYYQVEDWTSVSDVGKAIGGTVFSVAEYTKIETLYIKAVACFMDESKIDSLEVADIEVNTEEFTIKPQRFPYDIMSRCAIPALGQLITGELLDCACRLALREIVWCKLELAETFFVHFGYDYYMYIGSDQPCNYAIAQTVRSGLFVEPFVSPYR